MKAHLLFKIATAAVVAIVLLPMGGAARERFSAGSSPREAAAVAERLLRAVHGATGAPAMAVSVRRGPDTLWSQAIGSSDLEHATPATVGTRFRAASVSKLFTAAALLRLVQEQRIDLDAPVQTYVPGFPRKAEGSITIRQLAGHLSGIRHYRESDRRFEKTQMASVDEALAMFADDPLAQAPGTRYRYSSFGYTLLSAALEKAAGTPFLTLVRNAVFTPLGMAATMPDEVTPIIPRRSAWYQRTRAGIVNAPFVNPSYKWAAGGFLTTVGDLTNFALGHLDGRLFTKESSALLFAEQRTTDGTATGVGLGWRVQQDETGRRMYLHAGTMEGTRSVVILYPEEQLAIAVMTNLHGEPALIESTAQSMAEAFLSPAVVDGDAWSGTYDYAGTAGGESFAGVLTLTRSGDAWSGSVSAMPPLRKFVTAVGFEAAGAFQVAHVSRSTNGIVAWLMTPVGVVPLAVSPSAAGALEGRIAQGPVRVVLSLTKARGRAAED